MSYPCGCARDQHCDEALRLYAEALAVWDAEDLGPYREALTAYRRHFPALTPYRTGEA